MAFHFFCPTGHLLQADERHVGRAAVCPYCNTTLRIPAVRKPARSVENTEAAADVADARPSPGDRGAVAASSHDVDSPSLEVREVASDEGAFAALDDQAAAEHRGGSADSPEAERRSGSAETFFGNQPPLESEVGRPGAVHIPCPAGHVLETPPDMVGRDAMCPFCGQVFRLEFRNSLEYQQEQEQRAARQAERAARFWLQWAIAAAIVTVGGLILLIVLAAQR